MDSAWPKHHEECLQCLEVAFCRPVAFVLPGAVLILPHCLRCRLGLKLIDGNAALAAFFEHHPRAEARAYYAELRAAVTT